MSLPRSLPRAPFSHVYEVLLIELAVYVHEKLGNDAKAEEAAAFQLTFTRFHYNKSAAYRALGRISRRGDEAWPRTSMPQRTYSSTARSSPSSLERREAVRQGRR